MGLVPGLAPYSPRPHKTATALLYSMQNAVDTNTTQLHGLTTDRSVEFTFIAPSKSQKTVGGLLASWGG